MLQLLNYWDTKLFLFLNSLHSPFIDPIMIFVSDSYVPVAFLLGLFIIYGSLKLRKKILIAFFCALVGFGMADGISSKVFKPNFERLRPCRQPLLKNQIYLGGKKRCYGGKYGFFSSHAANSFAIATFFWLIFKAYTNKFFWLFPYAALVSYSRIYLAKHYPLDILAGAIFGLLCGWLAFRVYLKFQSFFQTSESLS